MGILDFFKKKNTSSSTEINVAQNFESKYIEITNLFADFLYKESHEMADSLAYLLLEKHPPPELVEENKLEMVHKMSGPFHIMLIHATLLQLEGYKKHNGSSLANNIYFSYLNEIESLKSGCKEMFNIFSDSKLEYHNSNFYESPAWLLTSFILVGFYGVELETKNVPESLKDTTDTIVEFALKGIERMVGLTDIPKIQKTMDELMTKIFSWDGRNIVMNQDILDVAQDVVERYGSVIESKSAIIMDSNDLPYSIDEIKLAIKTKIAACLLIKEDSQVEPLRAIYVILSSFIDLTNEEKESIENFDTISSNVRENRDISKEMICDLAAGETYLNVQKKSQRESNKLIVEIRLFCDLAEMFIGTL